METDRDYVDCLVDEMMLSTFDIEEVTWHWIIKVRSRSLSNTATKVLARHRAFSHIERTDKEFLIYIDK